MPSPCQPSTAARPSERYVRGSHRGPCQTRVACPDIVVLGAGGVTTAPPHDGTASAGTDRRSGAPQGDAIAGPRRGHTVQGGPGLNARDHWGSSLRHVAGTEKEVRGLGPPSSPPLMHHTVRGGGLFHVKQPPRPLWSRSTRRTEEQVRPTPTSREAVLEQEASKARRRSHRPPWGADWSHLASEKPAWRALRCKEERALRSTVVLPRGTHPPVSAPSRGGTLSVALLGNNRGWARTVITATLCFT